MNPTNPDIETKELNSVQMIQEPNEKDDIAKKETELSIKSLKSTPKLKLDFKEKFVMNKQMLKKIALDTMSFVRKNKYVTINFISILKYSLLMLFIEYSLYLTLQLCAYFILPLYNALQNTNIVVLIVFMVCYLATAVTIIIIQLKSNMILILILKICEFFFFAVSISNIFQVAYLNNLKCFFHLLI